MKTLLTVEKNVRRVVFKSLWKFFDVKNLSDLAMLGLFATGFAAVGFMFIKGLINWL